MVVNRGLCTEVPSDGFSGQFREDLQNIFRWLWLKKEAFNFL